LKDKTLFSIFLPATQKSYELWIPNELSVYVAKELVCKILADQEARYFISDANTALYEKASGNELDVNSRVGDLDYVNGTQLVLV
jgi:hypothetical protein